jgi:hypothetical protein
MSRACRKKNLIFSIGFDFSKREMEEQFSVPKPFADNTKDEEEVIELEPVLLL